MARQKLRVYVWDKAFYDYSAGLAFAVAHDAEEARDLVADQAGWRPDDLAKSPKVFDLSKCEPFAFFVHGGS